MKMGINKNQKGWLKTISNLLLLISILYFFVGILLFVLYTILAVSYYHPFGIHLIDAHDAEELQSAKTFFEENPVKDFLFDVAAKLMIGVGFIGVSWLYGSFAGDSITYNFVKKRFMKPKNVEGIPLDWNGGV